ncbi:amyloid-beta A4 precursor protein-binding family A member 2 isoform X2 [Amyelois transitella]|uniref:amyloid-beta A4 precursor protein-binding family A member 2 isoform X2 n=1 Tax=Amyelois transitella TaxID=680683 RepID=UPI00298FD65D|nr:amyloid-beta A4 precursor protein-binding family A member 2 isoform X2 [Amyelois transitella]
MSAAALRADGAGDSTPGSDVGERITRLFPKCRPKNMQHQHDRLNSGLEGRDNNVNNLSSDEERDSQLVILNSKGGTYKLRDSRIIEIAGGRELYSASRTKAVRKLRHNSTHKHNMRNRVRALNKDPVEYDNITNELPLHRINSEPKKISRHTSPTYTNGDKEPLEPRDSMGIPKNSSPILDPHKTTDVSTKSSPIAVVADGEVVVFDDNDDWKVILNSVSLGLRTEPDATDDEIDTSVRRTLENMKNGDIVNNKSESEGSDSSPSPEDVRLSDSSPPGVWMSGDEDKNRVTRVIGELPIAEYEGSPRRYGVGSVKATSNRSPRPGFPQRVVTESRDITPPSGSAAFDYLYEFSETRKVLEEFFKCPAMAGQMALNSNDEIVNFQDLDYELRRQTQECPSENGLEGGSESEWPQPTDTMDSPHTTHNHTNFLGLQQQRARYPEPNVAELSVGRAWSGPASPRARAPFALSSDTSDTGSDLSLMLMEDEISELKVRELEANRVVVTHLPIVEDGLSSEHASDNDNNNQMISIQNHSSVVIQEIVENGTNTDPHLLTDADLHSLDPLASCGEVAPPPPAPAPHRPASPAHAPRPDDVYPPRKRPTSAQSGDSVEIKPTSGDEDEADTDLETDRLLGQQRTDDQGFFDEKGWRKPKSRTVMPAGSVTGAARSPHAHEPDNHDNDAHALHNGKDKDGKKKCKNKEDAARKVLIEGVLFRARYLGSTQLACEGQPTKATRMLQAEEAVSRIKAPEGENQPSTEVDLFISTEKIMVLNTELKEIMMDHALRTISYIADIGDLVVLMARRRFVPHENDSDQPKLNRTPKMICHVFESEEAQFIAQSIGQAFQVAYMEFLKANGIEDHSFVKEMDYQEVLNSQEIFGDELQMFAKKKEVVVPKTKGEILGVVVVESGWGSMLPTVVIANLAPAGAAARCGQLNIGDQIIAINGVSLVGLPLSTCQTYIKNSKNQTVVKLTVVPCAPVVEVKIKRPDTKYQLGFSVQNGVICSLLRGGIAERGGVRVGHRIIEINSQSVVAVPHERIVNLLATSVGEILMKTMPTSMFRLLTGQENPVFI